jgi:cytochrome c-type biogenesis protein CcmH
MTIWIVLGALTLLVAAYVLWPVLRAAMGVSKAPVSARETEEATPDDKDDPTAKIDADTAADQDELQRDLTVYRDQLAEIERDIERGVLTREQADAARTEVERRILATDQRIRTRAKAREGRSPDSGILRPTAVALVFVSLIAGIGIYLDLGRPDLPDRPIASRTNEIMAARQSTKLNKEREDALKRAVADLSQKLIKEPGNLKNWELLGNSLMALGRNKEAETAFLEAVRQSNRSPDYLAMYAESVIRANDGQVNAVARGALEEAAKSNTANPRIPYYIGLSEIQSGHPKAGIERWIAMVNNAETGAQWVPMVVSSIQQAARTEGVDISGRLKVASAPAIGGSGGPSQEEMKAAANMTPEQRRDMIKGMVQRLADRLAEHPDDPDGWMRLIRAYGVIGDTDAARDAYGKASKALSGNTAALDRLGALGQQLGIATN